MIDLTTVKAGDKLHTRQGDVLVVYWVYDKIFAGGHELKSWQDYGCWPELSDMGHPLDIIRIEKHEPVVEVFYADSIDFVPADIIPRPQHLKGASDSDVYKITITDGVPSIEKVGE